MKYQYYYEDSSVALDAQWTDLFHQTTKPFHCVNIFSIEPDHNLPLILTKSHKSLDITTKKYNYYEYKKNCAVGTTSIIYLTFDIGHFSCDILHTFSNNMFVWIEAQFSHS